MFVSQVHLLNVWLHAHPHWAGIVAFFISFAESLAVIGLFLPGSLTMGAIGTLIGAGIIPMTETFIWAAVGAASGDVLSYWLGYYCKQRIRYIWPLRLYPQWIDKGEAFFSHHGGKSVFIGRFIGPMRPIMPMIAGIMKMPFRRFLAICIVASCGWAPAYMFPGILIGMAAMEMTSSAALYFLLKIAGIAIAAVILLIALWEITTYFFEKLNQERQWRRTVFVATLIVFCWVIFDLKEKTLLLNINHYVWQQFHSMAAKNLQPFFHTLTLGGSAYTLWTAVIVTALWFAYCRYWRAFWFWLANAGIAHAAIQLLKTATNFPRPPIDGHIIANPAFPSGHTTLTMAITGFLVVLVNPFVNITKQWLLMLTCGFYVSAIAVSRLYLGVHWFSDILGGLLLGLLCIQANSLLYNRKPNNVIPFFQTIGIFCIGLAIGWCATTWLGKPSF